MKAGILRTYKLPSRKTLCNMIFSRNFNCSLDISRIGSANTMTSVDILITAFATQNIELSIQVPSIALFHERSIGTHWKIVAKTVAIPELTIMPRAQKHSHRKCCAMKMRMYSSMTDILFKHTTILYGVCASQKNLRQVRISALLRSRTCLPYPWTTAS